MDYDERAKRAANMKFCVHEDSVKIPEYDGNWGKSIERWARMLVLDKEVHICHGYNLTSDKTRKGEHVIEWNNQPKWMERFIFVQVRLDNPFMDAVGHVLCEKCFLESHHSNEFIARVQARLKWLVKEDELDGDEISELVRLINRKRLFDHELSWERRINKAYAEEAKKKRKANKEVAQIKKDLGIK